VTSLKQKDKKKTSFSEYIFLQLFMIEYQQQDNEKVTIYV